MEKFSPLNIFLATLLFLTVCIIIIVIADATGKEARIQLALPVIYPKAA